LGVLIGSILKAGFLYLIVNVLVSTISLPKIFLTTMGINQLITAIIGGIVGYILYSKTRN